MSITAMILTGVIGLVHVYIAWFEMFAWESRGPAVFRNFPREMFAPTKVLAANQGLYNAFLAAGLFWSLTIADPVWQSNVATCFLLFVLVAGLYGAATASRKILFVQAIPAAVALALVLLV